MSLIKSAVLVLLSFSSALIFAGNMDIYQKMVKGEAIILDVREEDEIKSGMIKGAQWIPLSDLNRHPIESIKKLKALLGSKALHIYCRSGQRANTFIHKIKEQGLAGTNLGGFSGLENQGLPVIKP
jgi:phage shock protein E